MKDKVKKNIKKKKMKQNMKMILNTNMKKKV